ncbi:MAG TPA: Rid family hydrolase [Dehalococcoidia bacterium]|jgi:enamine deaminase RidA (YjgF/YER057c/UK114 family)|nr:Rid family hydrolase [Dehalococcoidia bacterium]
MQRDIINPWKWQDRYGFVQANRASGADRVLFCAGQGAADEDGNIVHSGDISAQTAQCLDNLETVLKESGFTLADVVRLNYYTTDVQAFFDRASPVLAERFAASGCRPASTLLGVAQLALPGMVIEIEATAVA